MDYDDIIDRAWEDVPEAVVLPDGQWLVKGGNVSLVKPKEEGKSFRILWNYTAEKPVNVDRELLTELGDYDITTNELVYTQYVEKPSDWNKVREHLALHGVEIDPSEKIVVNGKLSFAKAFRNSEVVATLAYHSFETQAGETVEENKMTKFSAVAE